VTVKVLPPVKVVNTVPVAVQVLVVLG